MAAYFIDYIKTYSNTNNKGRELQQFIGQFTQRLVKDDFVNKVEENYEYNTVTIS